MMHGLITNELLKAQPGQGVYAAMLTAKGRMIADVRVFRRADGEVLVDVARESLDGTREHLKKMVPPPFARWAEATEDDRGDRRLRPPLARAAVRRAGDGDPRAGGGRVRGAGVRRGTAAGGGHARGGGRGGVRRLLARGARGGAVDGAARMQGARPVGFGVLETLRMEAGRPRYGMELTEETIPTEAYESSGLMQRAISFHKGCYTGQEVIVRIAHRGHVNRHLRGLLLGDAPAPAARAPLV